MLGKRLANPAIFAVFCPEDDDEVVAGDVVGVEEIGDDAEETEAAGKEEEFVFVAKFFEDVLLEVLRGVSAWGVHLAGVKRTSGSDSFTGVLSSAGAMSSVAAMHSEHEQHASVPEVLLRCRCQSETN